MQQISCLFAPILHIARRVFSIIPEAAPLQPAWHAPITPALLSAINIGAQSAVNIPRSTSFLLVTRPSA